MKSTKKSLWASGLSLLVCFALLLGTTFAWFTDSVTNKGNVITAGNLSIDAYAYDLGNDGAGPFTIDGVNNGQPFTFEKDGQNLQAQNCPAIINETTWEPGISNAKLLTVTNSGDLATKVKLEFDVTDEGLMNALWFDFIQVDQNVVTGQFVRRPMSELTTLAEQTEVSLNAGQSVSFILVYGMDEDAGNEYQGKTFSADVSILATQNTVEQDGFGNNNYDSDAVYKQVTVELPDDGGDSAANGEALQNTIDTAEEGSTVYVPTGTYSSKISVDKPMTIVGNGAVLTENIFVSSDGVTLQNIDMEIAVQNTGDVTCPIQTNNNSLTLNNCNITRTTDTAQPYGMLVNVGTGTLTATGTVFTAPYNPSTAFNDSPSVIEAGEIYLDNCVIATDGYGLFAQHVTKGTIKNTTFTGVDGRPTLGCFNSTVLDGLVFDGCTFELGYNSIVSAGNFTIKNSTFDFTNTPADGAGNGINVYAQNGSVVLENNTFKLSAGKIGINLTSASWASGGHDASQVTISGNTFEGSGKAAINISSAWDNESASSVYENNNTLNGNSVTIN